MRPANIKVIIYTSNLMEPTQIAKAICYALSAGRDSSHDATHSERVVYNAHMYSRGFYVRPDDVEVVAWLHDVADHKYDQDGRLAAEVQEALKGMYPDSYQTVWRVINAISYSRERREGLEALREGIDDYWWMVRNIVSDADKIEALGEVGIRRCMEYSKAKRPGASDEEIARMVREHVEEKLGHLHTLFRTPLGRVEAGRATEEMHLFLAEMCY